MKQHPLVGKKAIHNAPRIEVIAGKFVNIIQKRDIKVMAVADGYAMVRRPRAMPYAAPLMEIESIP